LRCRKSPLPSMCGLSWKNGAILRAGSPPSGRSILMTSAP
jgi:hypothetical protein